MLSTPEIILGGLAGLITSMAGHYIIALRHGAEDLDRERANDIVGAAKQLNDAQKTVSQRDGEIASLKEAIKRKHPHDEAKEAQIVAGLEKLDEKERGSLRWFLDAGKISRGKLQAKGFNPENTAARMGIEHLFAYDSIRPGSGIAETDRVYYINPEMKDALRNVLYPPEDLKRFV